MRFGVFGQIDADERVLGAEQLRGDRARELRLADAARSKEEKTADGLARIFETRATAPDRLRDRVDRALLADDAFRERMLEIEQVARLFFRESRACGMPVHLETIAATSATSTTVHAAERDGRRRFVDEIDRRCPAENGR